jgi:hypothetical protein
MEPDLTEEPRETKARSSGPAPERSSFAFGSLVFGSLSLLAALFLNLTIFGAIMGGMGSDMLWLLAAASAVSWL